MSKSGVLEQTLRLRDINHLFEEPELSPFSEYYAEYSAKAGLDYVVGELYAHPETEQINLKVLLPPENIGPDLEARTLTAIRRYSDAWARNAKQDLAESSFKGRSHPPQAAQ